MGGATPGTGRRGGAGPADPRGDAAPGATGHRYDGRMTESGPLPDSAALYRFSRPGGIEVETKGMESDEAAEIHARDLSTEKASPIVIERRNHVDWEYITEVDERP